MASTAPASHACNRSGGVPITNQVTSRCGSRPYLRNVCLRRKSLSEPRLVIATRFRAYLRFV